MRTWGRVLVFDENGDPVIDPATGQQQKEWVKVTTAPNGDNSAVWITTLAQCIQLNLGESPFFANYGIPAEQSVLQQIAPDYAMALMQQQFTQYFAALLLYRAPEGIPPEPANTPTYIINATTLFGATLTIPVPT